MTEFAKYNKVAHNREKAQGRAGKRDQLVGS